MHCEWTTVESTDPTASSSASPSAPMRVYVCKPDGDGPFPAVVVIQEAFGVSEHIRDVTEKLAAAGFLAAAPDLFHRWDQSALASGDMQAVMGVARKLTEQLALDDVRATVDLLQSRPDARAERVGIVGFCLGGRVAFLSAMNEPRVCAAVSYYGGGIVSDQPTAPIRRAESLHAPTLLFFGENDTHVPPAHAREIDATLTRLGKEHEVVVYPDAGHGFLRDRPAGYYEPRAAADAWARTLAFFARHL